MKTELKLGLLRSLHYDFSTLESNYSTSSEELINVFDITGDNYLEKEWLIEMTSKETKELLVKFRNKWIYLLETKSYACIEPFMQIDNDWNDVIQHDLNPLLRSIEIDILAQKSNLGEYTKSDIKFESQRNNNRILNVADHFVKMALKKDFTINPFYKRKV